MQPLQADDPDRVGSYRLLARLGAGGMGVVYLGRSRSGRMVAVKVARKAFTADPRFRARFRREVEAARTVTGVFTAPVLEADAEATRPWLVTAYLPGLSLAEAVGTFGGLPPEAVRALAAGLAEALAAIHDAGVVHRDLKPDNIMLTAGRPSVIDFGIARPEDSTAITRAGVPIGTPGFMSPEQARGEEIGPPGDIFALGATLAYAASGIEPFGTGSMRSRLYRVVRAQAESARSPTPGCTSSSRTACAWNPRTGRPPRTYWAVSRASRRCRAPGGCRPGSPRRSTAVPPTPACPRAGCSHRRSRPGGWTLRPFRRRTPIRAAARSSPGPARARAH